MKSNVFMPLFLFGILCLSTSLVGQTPEHTVAQNLFVLGNIENLKANDPLFDELDALIKKQKEEVIVLFSGDFVDEDGFETKPQTDEIAKVSRLMALGTQQTQLVFLPGDKEWSNGSKKGLKKVKALENFIRKNGDKRHHFITEDGCLGPYVLDIGETLRIVGLNTHWFVHEHKRPEEQDADCDIISEHEFWGELEDIFREDDNRNIVLAGHHPVFSYGHYAGYKLGKQHLMPPIIGSFIAGYHQNVGSIQDLAREEMDNYANNLENLLERSHGIIYASGHEYDIQVNAAEDNYHINSGSLMKMTPTAKGEHNIYRHSKRGMIQFRFFKDGAIDMLVHERQGQIINVAHKISLYDSPCQSVFSDTPINEYYQPCRESLYKENTSIQKELPKTGTAIAGDYRANFLTRFFIGKHYRKAWNEPVKDIEYLDLDNTFEGLTAYAKGGAAQTRSVKLKSADGEVFAFRSVDKNPTQKMDKDMASGIVGDINKDITATQHPYAGNILYDLMDKAEIPNPEGQIYLLPDHPNLGPYRDEFKGMLGWLERRPKSKKDGSKIYKNADKALSTAKINKMMFEDHDHFVDPGSFLAARLFDMWVTDWDRHGKNISWLGYGDKKQMTFHAFPKDRDKALTRLDGFFRVLDWPMLASRMHRLRPAIYNLKPLNFKSRSMDRQHLMTYQLEDYLKATKDFQKTMTDEVINRAVRKLPPEVYPYDGPRIAKVLKLRRDKMQDLITNYYDLLARYIHFIGSNKKEVFEIKRHANGDVHVAMYDKTKDGGKGKLLKERLCKKGETKEIRLYGLGGEDDFYIDGEAKKSITIRIAGGKSSDKIIDSSKASGGKKTKIYDYKGKDELQLGKEGKVVKMTEALSFQMDKFYDDDHFKVFPFIAFNADDGVIFSVGGSTTLQKFNKPGYGSKYSYSFLTTTNGKYNINTSADFKHVIGEWNLHTGLSLGRPNYFFPRFFGLGNESVIDDTLLDADYYDNEMSSISLNVRLNRDFWNGSFFSGEVVSEFHNVFPNSEDNLEESIYDLFPDDIKTTLIGPKISLDIDFRDSKAFPTKGIQFKTTNYTFYNSALDGLGGRVEGEVSSFWSLGAKTPLTLGVKAGGSKSYGETPFYYKSFLGQTGNLRGFRKNRFAGNSTLYMNSELRWHIGKFITPLATVYWGVFGFYDAGRTYLKTETSDTWHTSYGGGVYLIPFNQKSFNLVLTTAHSKEESLLISFGVGFFVR